MFHKLSVCTFINWFVALPSDLKTSESGRVKENERIKESELIAVNHALARLIWVVSVELFFDEHRERAAWATVAFSLRATYDVDESMCATKWVQVQVLPFQIHSIYWAFSLDSTSERAPNIRHSISQIEQISSEWVILSVCCGHHYGNRWICVK